MEWIRVEIMVPTEGGHEILCNTQLPRVPKFGETIECFTGVNYDPSIFVIVKEPVTTVLKRDNSFSHIRIFTTP